MVGRPIAPDMSALTPAEADLRERVFAFLARAEEPLRWTFFLALRPPGRSPPGLPELVIEAGGRIAYVALCRQGGGPLAPDRASALALAGQRSGAAFVVRSLPEMEHVLHRLGLCPRPAGRLLHVADSTAGDADAPGR